MSQLADQLVPGHGSFLPNAGPASGEVLGLLGNETLTQPFLGALFWHSFVRTRWYGAALAEAGVPMAGPVERIVVPHAGGGRYDLVVLARGYDGPPVQVDAHADPRELSLATGSGPALTLAENIRSGVRFGSRRPTSTWEAESFGRLLARAVTEVARAESFGMVVAPAPDWELTGGVAVQPPVPVFDGLGALSASLGVFHRDGNRVLATTALHAVMRQPSVRVGPGIGTVLTTDAVTDSCLLELDHDPFAGPGFGLRGASTTRPPRQYTNVSFEGAGSGGRVTTMLHAFDESILDLQPFLATKIYTDPDTVPGDSGAALVDQATDEVMGFAAYRSSITSPLRFSAWVWAEQVYDAHGL